MCGEFASACGPAGECSLATPAQPTALSGVAALGSKHLCLKEKIRELEARGCVGHLDTDLTGGSGTRASESLFGGGGGYFCF